MAMGLAPPPPSPPSPPEMEPPIPAAKAPKPPKPAKPPKPPKPAQPAQPEWVREIDSGSNAPYWYNTNTHVSTWTDPTAAKPPAPAVPESALALPQPMTSSENTRLSAGLGHFQGLGEALSRAAPGATFNVLMPGAVASGAHVHLGGGGPGDGGGHPGGHAPRYADDSGCAPRYRIGHGH